MAEGFKIPITTTADTSGAEDAAASLKAVGDQAERTAEQVKELEAPVAPQVDASSVEAATASLIQALQAKGALEDAAFVTLDVNDDSVKEAIASVQALKSGLTDEELKSVTIDVSGFEALSDANTEATKDILGTASNLGTITSAVLDTKNAVGQLKDTTVQATAIAYKSKSVVTALGNALNGKAISARGAQKAISSLFALLVNPAIAAAAVVVGTIAAAYMAFQKRVAAAREESLKLLGVQEDSTKNFQAMGEQAAISAAALGLNADNAERLRKALDDLGDAQQQLELSITERDLANGIITEAQATESRARTRAAGEQRALAQKQAAIDAERKTDAGNVATLQNNAAGLRGEVPVARRAVADANYALRGTPSDQSFELTALKQRRDIATDPILKEQIQSEIDAVKKQDPTFTRARKTAEESGDSATVTKLNKLEEANKKLEEATAAVVIVENQLATLRASQAVAEKARVAEEETLRLRGVTSQMGLDKAAIDAETQRKEAAEKKAAAEAKANQEYFNTPVMGPNLPPDQKALLDAGNIASKFTGEANTTSGIVSRSIREEINRIKPDGIQPGEADALIQDLKDLMEARRLDAQEFRKVKEAVAVLMRSNAGNSDGK